MKKPSGPYSKSDSSYSPKKNASRGTGGKKAFSPAALSKESKEGKSRGSADSKERKKPFEKREGGVKDIRPDRKPYVRKDAAEGNGAKRPFKSRETDGEKKPFERRDGAVRDGRPERKPYARKDASTGDREKRPYQRREAEGEKKPFERKESSDRDGRSERKPYPRKDTAEGGKRPYKRPETSDGDKKPFRKREDSGDKRPFARKDAEGEGAKRPFKRRETDGERKPFEKRAGGDSRPERKPYAKREDKPGEKRPYPKKTESGEKRDPFSERKPFRKKRPEDDVEREQFEDKVYKEVPSDPEPMRRFSRNEDAKEIASAMTLNKYVAHSGECGRREAAAFVKQGKVRVNGELVLEPGYRVQPGDVVSLLGKKLTPQRNNVYVLLNKPKGYITTTDDPQERKTVMELVTAASDERLYPVGRLDRNTTGLLLMTNDGALAHKLSHPSYSIKKVYQVTLDKNLTKVDYQAIANGIELEDGKAQVDEIAYLEQRNEIGLEIHSGRNRIVRRIFESLGYQVEKLDRMMYAGLTKKNLPRGKWRLLDEKEVIMLKHFKS